MVRFRTDTILAAVFLLTTLLQGEESALKRGRNEGTMNIPASNVIGNGNITLFGAGIGSYGTSGTAIDPTTGISVGIANIMELKGKTSFTNFQGLGTSEAHLQLTIPGNDYLRFFGLALSGDLFLTSAADTIKSSAASGKPEFSSFMAGSMVIDLDWLALFKTFPLKTYFALSMADDPNLLFRYHQLSIKSGLEWKMYHHSTFLDIGVGLYKEKSTGSFINTRSYDQAVVWFEPGGRYRLWGLYSIVGSFRLAVYQMVNEKRPLPTTLTRLAVGIEVPLLYKETNTEAIRTLVFMEREKETKKDNIATTMEKGKRLGSGLDKEIKSLDLKSDIPDSEEEKEALQRREEIQQRMDEIEKLLEETK